MRVAFFYILMILSCTSLSAQINTDISLPKTWTADFIISLSHTGGMDGGSTHLTFTYDSCKYIVNSRNSRPQTCYFVMSDVDRNTILQKIHTLKLETIKSEFEMAAVLDGWASSICLGSNCIEGGSRRKMTTRDENIYLDAYRYLEDFAMIKCAQESQYQKKKKKK